MSSKSITQHYGIAGPVDFVNVEVDRDNRLFIDPSRIRVAQASSRYARQAYGLLVSFFDEVLRCINSSNPADARKGGAILQQFAEPNETRLGMSKFGVQGHGGSDGIGSTIWAELVSNPLCRHDVAVLKYIEDMPIFVDGVDADITSDVTTRIILPALADFTSTMLAKHGEFTTGGRPTATVEFQVWNPATIRWEPRSFILPVAAGKPLLLVPKEWVGPSLLMRFGQYHQVVVLTRLQQERTTYDAGRKRTVRPSKKSLAAEARFKRSRLTCITQTERVFNESDADLVASYRRSADERAVALTDEELAFLTSGS